MNPKPRRFPETSETLVSALLSQEAQVRDIALARFCTAYYPAFYGYARSLCYNEHDAQDRVQDFFVKIMREGLLQKFDPQRGGKLSSWLVVCFRNFVRGRSKPGMEELPLPVVSAEADFQTAYLAVLSPEPVFDLLLARQIWRSTRSLLLEKAQKKGVEKLVRDILPHTLLARWPDPPAPSQEEIAKRHGISGTRLKAYFNRTLKVQARREFDSESLILCPGITDEDTQHLWNLLCRYGDV